MTHEADSADLLDRLDMVARLYRLVLGRPPDFDGLMHYARERGDAWPRNVAASLLGSEEFKHSLGTEDPVARLRGNAPPRLLDSSSESAAPLELACALAERGDAEAWGSTARARHPEGIPIDHRDGYPVWLAEKRARRSPAPRIEAADAAPLLSVLIGRPADSKALDASLQSIASQGDRRVEVLVALGRKPDRAIQAACERHAGLPVRLVGARWPWSQSAALSKAALEAGGTFVCLLTEGDRLDEMAVAELSSAAEESDILLADADQERGTGPPYPLFTGGWDAEAALARPPDGLVAVRTSLLLAIGGFRSAAEGEFAWDLLLRASAAVDATRIRHLPAVLLHRATRCVTGGPASGRAIVRSHLDSTARRDCRIEGNGQSEPIRVVYPLPAAPPLASVIIATRDGAPLLRACLDGVLRRTAYPAMEVLILDNDSRETATARLLEEAARDPRVSVMAHAGPFNWSAMNNRAVEMMRGAVGVLLNNDTDVIDPGWLRELVSQAIRPSVGVVGAKLLYPDRTVQHAGVGMGAGCRSVHLWRHADGGSPGYLDGLRIVRSAAAVTGACMAFRGSVFREVGGLDQDHLRVTWSDTDLCMRVRAAGYKVVWTPHALLYHVELATRGSDDAPEARPRFLSESALFRSRWTGFADHDPYFSPSLVMESAAPRLKTIEDAPTILERS